MSKEGWWCSRAGSRAAPSQMKQPGASAASSVLPSIHHRDQARVYATLLQRPALLDIDVSGFGMAGGVIGVDQVMGGRAAGAGQHQEVRPARQLQQVGLETMGAARVLLALVITGEDDDPAALSAEHAPGFLQGADARLITWYSMLSSTAIPAPNHASGTFWS